MTSATNTENVKIDSMKISKEKKALREKKKRTQLNDMFECLRKVLPPGMLNSTGATKIGILRMATEYIAHLNEFLSNQENWPNNVLLNASNPQLSNGKPC